MKKIYYRGDKIRCKARFNRSRNKIELRIQTKERFWWWVNEGCLFEIDIEIGPPLPEDNQFPRMDPFRSSYCIGGYLEIWAAGTFDLDQRVESLLDEFCQALDRHNEAKKELTKHLQ